MGNSPAPAGGTPVTFFYYPAFLAATAVRYGIGR